MLADRFRGCQTRMGPESDTRCSYANIVARTELYDAGLTSVEKLGTMRRPGGGKWVIAATAIGSGTHVYGTSPTWTRSRATRC